MNVIKDESFLANDALFGVLEVFYPDESEWDLDGFKAVVAEELAKIDKERDTYVRADVFGQNMYSRYFKKFKKSYPVMMQYESYLLKGRPFPLDHPMNSVAFLTELKTHNLVGSHDLDRVVGDIVLFRATEKTPFVGLGGRDCHVYPKDVSGRDDEGIIFSMIAGADNKTYLFDDTRHVGYLNFCTPDTEREEVERMQDILTTFAKALAPTAEIIRHIY